MSKVFSAHAVATYRRGRSVVNVDMEGVTT